MQTYDLIMLAVLAVATILGARKGIAWQVASFTSIFASYYVAYQFREPVGQMIQASPPWNTFMAMLILYLGTALVIWLAFRFVSEVIDRVQLKDFDRHAGAVLGLARGVLWCVIITLFAVTLLGEQEKRAIVGSRSGYYIATLLAKANPVIPEEVRGVLAPYIHQLDARLEDNYRLPSGTDGPTSAAGADSRGGYFPAHITPAQGGYGSNITPAQGGYGSNITPAQGSYGSNLVPAQGGYGNNLVPAQSGYGSSDGIRYGVPSGGLVPGNYGPPQQPPSPYSSAPRASGGYREFP